MMFFNKKNQKTENKEIRRRFETILMERKNAYEKMDELHELTKLLIAEDDEANKKLMDEIFEYRHELLHKVIRSR